MTWIQTYTGRMFWPLEPQAADVDLLDIAHALSMKCRYSGHTHRFYSVAEHCVHVSRAIQAHFHATLPGEGLPYAAWSLWGLLHDATEAYLPDVARPIKSAMPGFAEIERRVMDAICEKFGLQTEEPEIVKQIDTRILNDESAALMPNKPRPWSGFGRPLDLEIECWSPDQARAAFLRRFSELQP